MRLQLRPKANWQRLRKEMLPDAVPRQAGIGVIHPTSKVR